MAPHGNHNRTANRLPQASNSAGPSTLHTFNVDELITPAEATPIESYVDHLSANGRRIVQEAVCVQPPSPVKRAHLGEPYPAATDPSPPEASNNDADCYSMTPDNYDDEDPPPSPSASVAKPQDKILAKCMRLTRNIYLVQLLRREGCADASSSVCPTCGEDSPRYRCQECARGLLLCQVCCLDKHADNPLHVIFEWNGIFFERTTLRKLGQRIQLGHPPRERCTHPQAAHVDFVVLHDNGMSTWISLLHYGWFPVSDDRPRTPATFLVLNHFHLHTLPAKTTAYDFYAVLERLTNNARVKPPDRYQVFLRWRGKYRHLLMLKWAGRGHDPSGVWGTGAGKLVIECPVCPDPKVNLPEGWENATARRSVTLDTCFRLKRRMISSEFKDPGLGTGWAYVTENAPYRHFLLTVMDQKEMGTCSGLAALDYVNTKFSRGYSTTGVGMGVCTRHEFVQPNGVGDLQRGERFANMDYIFRSILGHKDPRVRKLISYDIKLPVLMRITIILQMFRFVIPKMHIHAHTLACQVKFPLNLVPSSGQTDGEGIEHPWSNIGVIATSTRMSGPGAPPLPVATL
ncbi:hypothetical protein B0H14DRAFT_3572553 [Mycena olivaceomarginata]|nr:hypothetical protein B0H14DRAFT_3572553 [Mycena olivaceomarginata]